MINLCVFSQCSTKSFTLTVCPTSLPPANEVCEGYVFTGVCLSTGVGSVGETLPLDSNVRAVRILLECILVLRPISHQLYFTASSSNNFIFTASSSSTILWPISVQHPYFMVSSSNTFIMAISSSTYILGSVHPKPFYDQLVQHNITANWPPTLFYSQFVNTSILRVVCQQ